MSLKAGGVGLNLQAADYVFLYDPWWNEAVERQAVDRAHRMGQKNKVIARKYLVAESIEEKILKLQGLKQSLSQNLLEFEGEVEPVTLEDLYALLQ
jgi:SNF2 family DNA or RNA helicase